MHILSQFKSTRKIGFNGLYMMPNPLRDSDYCECLGRLKACFDSGLPDIYPIDQVVGPAREQLLVEVVLINPHKHSGAMGH